MSGQHPGKASRSPYKLRLSFNEYDYIKVFPKFKKPEILGGFSIDQNRAFCDDRSQLKFFDDKRFKNDDSSSYKKVSWNLNSGLEKVVPKIPANKTEGISHLLKWLVANKSKFANSSSAFPDLLPFDFVCFRGLLVVMMVTLYENNSDWEIHATKFRGTIYLCKKETDLSKQRESKMTSREKTMCSWGYKFEQYMQTSIPTKEPAQMVSERDENSHEPVDENEEFCCTFKTKLGDQTIFYGAEMDGFQLLEENSFSKPIDEINLGSDGHFVELKTSLKVVSDRQLFSFHKYKTLKWWAQSFLVGIETIICGFRDDAGFILSLEDFSVKSLPKLAPDPFWSGCVCMSFLESLLSCIKTSVKEEGKVYKFTRGEGSSIIVCNILEGETFLPDWYIKNMFGI